MVSVLRRVLVRGHMSVLATLAICLLASLPLGAYVAFLTPVYAIALALAAGGGLLMLRSRQFTLAVIIGVVTLLPFAALPMDVGFSPTFLNLALGVFYLIWALRVATGRQEPWVRSPLVPALVVFLLLIMVSFVAGLGHASLTPTALRRFGEIPLGIAIFLAVLNNVRTRRDLEQTTLWIILGGAAVAAGGLALYVMPQHWANRLLTALRVVRYPAGPNVLRFIEDNPDLPMRAISTQVDPNVLGAVLILTMGLTAPHLFSPKPLLDRRLLAAAMAVSGLCLFLTYSRGSFVGLAVGLAALGVLRYRRMVLAIALVASLLLLAPQTQGFMDHFFRGIRGEDIATQMRFGEYRDALTLIQRYPWLGVGFVDAPDIDLYLGVSSLYLLIAKQMGMVGLGAFLLCIAITFLVLYSAWRQGGHAPSWAPWLLGPAIALIAGLTGAVFDHTLTSFPHALTLFWLIVGLGATAAHLVQAAGGAEPAPAHVGGTAGRGQLLPKEDNGARSRAPRKPVF